MKSLDEITYGKLNKTCGVYLIHCNDYKYVGSSMNLYRRLKRHSNDLKRGKHFNEFVQRAYNKYGRNSFSYEILELCDNYIEREAYYIQLLNSEANFEKDPTSRSKSEQTKKKISESLLDRFKGKDNPASIKVYQYTSDGDFITEYDTIREAAQAVNGSQVAIGKAAMGKNKSSAGYQWSRIKLNKMNKLIPRKKGPYKTTKT